MSSQRLRMTMVDGATIAYQEWGRGAPRKLLASHGWLDNSNSHNILGPYLAKCGFHVVAFDWPGHGLSSHNAPSSPYVFQKNVAHMRNILEVLKWDVPNTTADGPTGNAVTDSTAGGIRKVDVLGHSMGAAISVLFAGTYPELVNRLVLIENFGPITKAASTARKSLRVAIDAERKRAAGPSAGGSAAAPVPGNASSSSAAAGGRDQQQPPQPPPPTRGKDGHKLYATLAEAVAARLKTVSIVPGNQTMSKEAALALVSRGVCRSSSAEGEDEGDITDLAAGPVRFRHDPRLLLPSYFYATPEQVLSYFESITAKTLLITAATGWPYTPSEMADRTAVLTGKGLLTHRELPGSHHLHMDPDDAQACAVAVEEFLLSEDEAGEGASAGSVTA